MQVIELGTKLIRRPNVAAVWSGLVGFAAEMTRRESKICPFPDIPAIGANFCFLSATTGFFRLSQRSLIPEFDTSG